MANTLEITIDHAQTRISVPATNIALLGAELLDSSQDEDVILLPVVNALALKPYQMDLAWFTSNSGSYLKPTIASGYEVKTAGKWFEAEVYTGAGKFLKCDDSSGEYARTSTAPGLNRGVSLSFHLYGADDVFLALQCGWSNSTSPTAMSASLGLEIYSNGEVRIYKDGTLLQAGRGSHNNLGLIANQVNHLVILPCRRRELLVFTRKYGQMGQGGEKAVQNGNGFVHVFDDIEEGEAAPIITPAGEKFFVTSGGTGNLLLQFAALTFATAGNALSVPWSFGTAPKTGASLFSDWYNPIFTGITNASVYGDTAYAGTTGLSAVALREEDDSGDFVPDGIKNQARVLQQLTGDGSYTPFIYGIVFQYNAELKTTNAAEEYVLTPYLMRNTLSVPDEPFGALMQTEVTLGLEIVESDVDVVTLLEDEVPNITSQSFRPIKFALDDQPPFFEGYIKRPKVRRDMIEQAERLYFDCEGIERMIADYVFRTRLPLDGLPLCRPVDWGVSAVSKVLEETGFDLSLTRLSPVYKAGTTDLYYLGEIPDAGCGEWNVTAEVGDTGRDILEKLHRFASDCTYGAHPGPYGVEFWFYTPDEIPTTPVIVLYQSNEDAEAAYPDLTSDECAELLFSDFEEETQEPEGNEVRATGVDPRTGAIIQSVATDDDSIDADLLPSERPSNWAGMPLPVGVASRSFRGRDDTDRTVEGLLPVATQQLLVGGFAANTILFYESEGVLLPVWRMDMVTLDGIGDRRISSLNGEFIKEVGDDDRVESYHARTATYTTGAIRGIGGTTIAQIQARQRARLRDRFVKDLREAPLLATGVLSVWNQ